MNVEEMRKEIHDLAYTFWLDRGKPTGDDWTDWFEAEKVWFQKESE
jgi:hypothetical protein